MRKKTLRAIIAVLVLAVFMKTAFVYVFAENRKVILNNSDKVLNAPQKVIKGTVYVPLRPVMEALGWDLEWDSVNRAISCTKDDSLFTLRIDSNEVSINGEQITLDKPAVISDGITYIPSKFIAKKFGTQIRWNKKDNLIILSDYDEDNISLEGEGNIVIAGGGIIVNIFEPYSTDTLHDMLSYADRLLAKNNAEGAIGKYKEILSNISVEDTPEIYIHVLNNIGNAYSLLAETRDAKKNILCSIALYKKVLQYSKAENTAAADSCALVLNNLGNAYRVLSEVSGDKKDMDKAVKTYKEALRCHIANNSILDSALVYYNLGLTYRQMNLPDMANVSLANAEDSYKKALEVFTIKSNPSIYALIQYNLGNIYKVFSEMKDADISLKDAKAAYEEALKVWNVESYPINYARVHKCMGEVYSRMYQEGSNKENLKQALTEYNESLKLFTLDMYPIDYAKVNMEIGNTNLMLAGSKGDEKCLERAVMAYNEALRVFKPLDYPAYNKYITDKLNQIENGRY